MQEVSSFLIIDGCFSFKVRFINQFSTNALVVGSLIEIPYSLHVTLPNGHFIIRLDKPGEEIKPSQPWSQRRAAYA